MQMDVTEGLFCTEPVSIPPQSQRQIPVKMRDKQKDIATGALAKPNKHNSISAATLSKTIGHNT